MMSNFVAPSEHGDIGCVPDMHRIFIIKDENTAVLQLSLSKKSKSHAKNTKNALLF